MGNPATVSPPVALTRGTSVALRLAAVYEPL